MNESASTVVRGLVADIVRSKKELLAENAMLRQQLIIAARKLKQPRTEPAEHTVMECRSPMNEHGDSALPSDRGRRATQGSKPAVAR